jgi:hypothetical protein
VYIAEDRFGDLSGGRLNAFDAAGVTGCSGTPRTAELCPRSNTAAKPVTKQTCYIGNSEPRGIDTMTLVGAARITVTYP